MTAHPRTLGKPVVLVPACNRVLGQHPFHIVGKKYIDAATLAGCRPLVVPGAESDELDTLLDLADGVLLTGSPSNVHPLHFDEGLRDPSLPLDTARDRWTLPLILRILTRGIPLLAICRGMQELNVALGGTLSQAVHAEPGMNDHRADDDASVEQQYAAAHEVTVTPGGRLAPIVGIDRFRVNSLHGQAIKRLAQGLRVEARAPDGVIEAVSADGGDTFAIGVQWHPEWQAADNPVSMRLLEAFGEACRAFAERRQGNDPRWRGCTPRSYSDADAHTNPR